MILGNGVHARCTLTRTLPDEAPRPRHRKHANKSGRELPERGPSFLSELVARCAERAGSVSIPLVCESCIVPISGEARCREAPPLLLTSARLSAGRLASLPPVPLL